MLDCRIVVGAVAVVPVSDDAPVRADAVDAAPEITLGIVGRFCPPVPL